MEKYVLKYKGEEVDNLLKKIEVAPNNIASKEEITGYTITATKENPIDLNTFTTPGIYLIKNLASETATNIPSDLDWDAETYYDVVLTVTMGQGDIYQEITHGENTIPVYCNYRRSSFREGEWSAWQEITLFAHSIYVGKFKAGMGCWEPTADDHLTNKKYVDTSIATAVTGVLEGSY